MENAEGEAHLEDSSGEEGAEVGNAGEPLASHRRSSHDGHGRGRGQGAAALPMEVPGDSFLSTRLVDNGVADSIPSSRRNLRSADSETCPTDNSSRRGARPKPGRSIGRSATADPPRHRARGLATPLPPAFPPLPREVATMGNGGDGASSTSSSRTSPEIDRSRVSATGLDVANELELSVPSHQEHLTADGQR